MQLMRKNLNEALTQINDAHAGLLIQRGLSVWESDDDKKLLRDDNKKTAKEKIIATLASLMPNELYLLAFERWLENTLNTINSFTTTVATVEGRLYTDLSLAGALETGTSIHHTYGMPILVGSSIKGAVRVYTEYLFAKRDAQGRPQFIDNDSSNDSRKRKLAIPEDKQPILDILFGTDTDDIDKADAGYLIWHDAWWIPMLNAKGQLSTEDKYKPFVEEIVTVHHQQYYERKQDKALDMENPVPNQQLAIQGGFYFVIEGEQRWANLAKDLLQETIENLGLGAKGTSGYGYFKIGSQAFDSFLDYKPNLRKMKKP